MVNIFINISAAVYNYRMLRNWHERTGLGDPTHPLLAPDDDVAGRRDGDDAAPAGPDARDLGRQRVDDQVVLELEGVLDEWRPVDLRQLRDADARVGREQRQAIGLGDVVDMVGRDEVRGSGHARERNVVHVSAG